MKHSSYKQIAEDRTGVISPEEDAVKTVGGRLVVTDEITNSSSKLLKRHLPVVSEEVSDYLDGFAAKYSADDVIRYLENARSLKVLVVGEAIIDEYQYCTAIGKSSKEPTLVVKAGSVERFAGGILAVANHVANFCDHVGIVTFLGTENSQEAFVEEELNSTIERFFFYKTDAPTIVKRRFIDQYFSARLFEVYEIDDQELNSADDDRFCALLRSQLPQYDLVIVVDFGHGMMSRGAIDLLRSQAPFLALNVQANAGNLGYHTVSAYPRADYISIDEPEIRLDTRDRRGDLKPMVLELSRKLGCERVAITRGSSGCLCYDTDHGFCEIPALADQVVDRIGAGDAFLTLTALCAAQNAPMEVVGFIGNAAGAQAVKTIGHRNSIQLGPLFKHIRTLLK